MRNIILILGILLGLYSCNKDDKDQTNPTNKSAYLPMTEGNYWVYQYYGFDSNGIEYPTNYYDSVVISNDTILNGKTYFRHDIYEYYRTGRKPDLTRSVYYLDSSKCLVNNYGRIVFSENNFIDTIYRYTHLTNWTSGDTFGWSTFKMERVDTTITLPAGSFSNLLNYRQTFIPNIKFYPAGIRYTNQYYSKNVGVILSTFFNYASPYTNEKRLISYNINK
jgi:hypothetical protein